MGLAKSLAGSMVMAVLVAGLGCGNGGDDGGGGGGGGAPDAGGVADGGACAPGLTLCADDTPSCEDLQSSNGNCGACNLRCPSGTSCQAGSCRTDGSGGVPDAGGGSSCPPGFTLCVDDTPSCEDLMSSGGNCGACDHKCPSGTSCESGVCR